MILAVTGHRPERLRGQEKAIKEWAATQLTRLQPSAIYDGMAQGTDQIVATAAKELNIPIICCYPFPKKYYHPIEQWIMENNQVIFVSPQYSKKAYVIRDNFMVDHSDKLLCVWDGRGGGGTGAAVCFPAERAGLHLWPGYCLAEGTGRHGYQVIIFQDTQEPHHRNQTHPARGGNHSRHPFQSDALSLRKQLPAHL